MINDFFYTCNDLVNENYLWKDSLHLTNEGSSVYLNRIVNDGIWLMTENLVKENVKKC